MTANHRSRLAAGLAVALAAILYAPPARAVVSAGQPAPYFAKFALDDPAFGQTTLRDRDYYGTEKVLVIFVLGHS